jgi:hypothetical protein
MGMGMPLSPPPPSCGSCVVDVDRRSVAGGAAGRGVVMCGTRDDEREPIRRSVAIRCAVRKDQTAAQIGLSGVLAKVSTSLAAECFRVTEPALRDGRHRSFRDRGSVMFGDDGSAHLEVATEGLANDVRRRRVIFLRPVVDRLPQLWFEPDRERVSGTGTHRRAPRTSPQLGDVESGLSLLGHPLQDLVGQLNTGLGPSVGPLLNHRTLPSRAAAARRFVSSASRESGSRCRRHGTDTISKRFPARSGPR